jgi:hypothetical protein
MFCEYHYLFKFDGNYVSFLNAKFSRNYLLEMKKVNKITQLSATHPWWKFENLTQICKLYGGYLIFFVFGQLVLIDESHTTHGW